MCDKCKQLIECPIGEKRKVVIEPGKPFTDYYGRLFQDDGLLFVIDKYPDHTDCFIVQHIRDENSVGYGFGIENVRFCPFCGENLRGLNHAQS